MTTPKRLATADADAMVGPAAAADTIAFLGGGNMAASLIGGLIAAGHPASRIRVSEPDALRAADLHNRFGVVIVESNAAAISGGEGGAVADTDSQADITVLATKPQHAGVALQGLAFPPGSTLISICAGLRIATLAALTTASERLALIRTMPNTPALFAAGITGLHAGSDCPPRARAQAEYLMGAAGTVCWIAEEALMEAVTAVSGSGPAYFFLLTEAMAEAGTALGLTPTDARQLALQTLIGAARMADASGIDIATLRAQVTSKGGTTEAAIAHFEAAGLRRIVTEALQAAADRGRVLGDQIDHSLELPLERSIDRTPGDGLPASARTGA